MAKTRTQETKQEIDPQVAANSEANMGLARMLASLGFQPYGGTDVAAFTPQQEASFDASNMAAGAFGMPTAFNWRDSMPTPTESESGIMGYNTQDMMKKEIGDERYGELTDFLAQFAEQASQKPKAKKRSSSGGGKK